MLDAEWSLTEVAEVVLVEVAVHNPTAVDRRVRVENRLEGPTLPPRSGGVPEDGWDADGYAGVVAAGDELRLGFASPAAPTEPPVAVEDEGRVGDDADAGGASPEAAVRLLGDASPPADAIPVGGSDGDVADTTGTANPGAADASDPEPPAAAIDDATAGVGAITGETNGMPIDAEDGTGSDTDDGTSGDDGAGEGGSGTPVDGADGTPPTGAGPGSDDRVRGETDRGDDGTEEVRDAGSGSWEGEGDGEEGEDAAVPPSVDAWLADVERRIEHGERLTDASVVEAAAVIDERGGLDGVEALPDRLAADGAALRALAERATATDVPLGALRRLS